MIKTTQIERSILKAIHKVAVVILNSNINIPTEPPKFSQFPYPTAYKGQNQAIEEICNNEYALLASPTGTGKTAVFLTASRVMQKPTLIIEPRVFLQRQVSEYGNYVYLRKRERYPCRFLEKLDEKKRRSWSFLDIDGHPCIFRIGDRFYFFGREYDYPCPDCYYEIDKLRAELIFEEGGIVVVNQGNFHQFLERAKELNAFVVIDEADEVLRTITCAISVPESEISEYLEDTTPDLPETVEIIDSVQKYLRDRKKNLEEELEKLQEKYDPTKDYKVLTKIPKINKQLEKITFDLLKVNLFKQNIRDVFYYHTEDGKLSVELVPKFEILEQLFEGCQMCFVSATPPLNNSVKVVKYHLPCKAKVVFIPYTNMSRSKIDVDPKKKKTAFERVSTLMKNITKIVELVLGKSIRVIIHCASYDYANSFAPYFENALVHERSVKLEDVIQEFYERNYKYLLVVAAEYGGDFKDVPLQFIPKVPYPALDERTRALKEKLGEIQFREWYNWTALSRLMQACGRTARKPNDFSLTVITDQSFQYLWRMYRHKLPEWFSKRLIHFVINTPPPLK